MQKPTGRTGSLPPAHAISWKTHQDDLDAFVLEVVETLGKDGTAVWYPLTAYTLRMVAAARHRLWSQGGCALRCQTDVDSDRLYVRADFSTARRFSAWTHKATTLGVAPRRLRLIRGKRKAA